MATGTVREGLDAVRDELQRLGRPVVGLLRPGLPEAEVRAALGEDVPQPIVDWFGWADGTAEGDDEEQTYDEASFIPGYILVSLAEALEFRAEMGEGTEDGGEWLPLLISPSGDFYAAVWPGEESAVEAGCYIGGLDEALGYPDLEHLLRTFVESYRTGAFDVDEEGFLDLEPELADRVYVAVNVPQEAGGDGTGEPATGTPPGLGVSSETTD